MGDGVDELAAARDRRRETWAAGAIAGSLLTSGPILVFVAAAEPVASFGLRTLCSTLVVGAFAAISYLRMRYR